MEDGDKKVEASIPVQSRIDIRALAEMILYWEREGRGIKTMSQLVNWSVDLCSQVLELNGLLPGKIDTLLEANNVLVSRGLYQAGVMKRGRKKLIRGRQLENYRLEGVDVKFGNEGRREYDVAHNSNSVIPAPDSNGLGDGTSNVLSQEELDKIVSLHRKMDADRVTKEAKDSVAHIEFDENDMAIVQSTGNNDYTEKDRLKDEDEQARERSKRLLKEAKDIVKKGDDRIARLDDEQFEEKERKRLEREKREKDAFDNFDTSSLSPMD